MLNMAALQVGAVEAGVRFYCLRWQYNANDRVGVSVGKSARSLSSSGELFGWAGIASIVSGISS
jgi:hypothetical protein